MPYHPFFDAPTYPWRRLDAHAFYVALYGAIDKTASITGFYKDSGGTRPLAVFGYGADLIWREALENLTLARCLSRLCDLLLTDDQLLAIHDRVLDVKNSKEMEPEQHGITFLDRKRLRGELEKLSQLSTPYGVLLVRGPPGSGKSWTQQFISRIAEDRGARSIYLFEGLVSNVPEVAEQLFTVLDSNATVPDKFETEEAWYRKICVKLQGLAQKNSDVLWVIADDIGQYPNGPRLDPEIRSFFEQFALHMANPVFARCFRLILLDYPDGPVPTKWRSFWCEDRPDEKDVDEDAIATFLERWAAWNKKQLPRERAMETAKKIVANADTPRPGAGAHERRLKRIHMEISDVLGML